MAQKKQFIDVTARLHAVQSHPLVQGRFYFLLPVPLLDSVVRKIGEPAFDPVLLQMDRYLGELMDADPHLVALHCGKPVHYPLLAERVYASRSLPAELSTGAAGDWSSHLKALQDLDVPLDSAHEHARGYCGWLMSNPTFLREQRAVFAAGTSKPPEPVEWLPPAISRAVVSARRVAGKRLPRGASRLIEQLHAFLQKWRLAALGGPGLPVLFFPQRGIHLDRFVPTHLQTVTHAIVSHGIFPELDRHLFERVAPTGSAQHLRDWMKIVSISNRRRRDELAALGRLFQLQQHVRTLQQRHAVALHRNVGKLEHALAAHFGVKHATIRADLQYLRDRLGDPWFA